MVLPRTGQHHARYDYHANYDYYVHYDYYADHHYRVSRTARLRRRSSDETDQLRLSGNTAEHLQTGTNIK